MGLNLLPNTLDRSMGTKKAIRKRLVLAQQAQKKMFRLDVRGSKLTRLITSEEDNSTGFLSVAFEHVDAFPIQPLYHQS